MSPTFKAVCFVIATVLFVAEYVVPFPLVPAGLAAFALPFAWDAVDAA